MSLDEDLKKIQETLDFLREHRLEMTEAEYCEGLLSLAALEAPYFRKRAIQRIQYVGKHSTRYGGLHHTLGRLCYDEGMYENAVQQMRLALEEDFADPTVRYNYAVAQIGIRESEDAWSILSAMMKHGSDDRDIRYAYTIAAVNTDRIPEALDVAREEYIRDMRYLFLLHLCHDYKTLVQYFDAVPMDFVQYPYLLKLYASSLMLSGDAQRALEVVEEVKAQINPFLDDNHERKAMEQLADRIRKREFSFAVRPIPDMKDAPLYYEK